MWGFPGESVPNNPLTERNDPLKCILVLQGDLIEVDYYGEVEQVRLIGVRAPEFRAFSPDESLAKDARLFTRNLLEGKEVYLDYGKSFLDKDDRILAYVYLKDGSLINGELIKQGYGRVWDAPFKFSDLFRLYQERARDLNRGIWGEAGDAKRNF